MRAAVAREERLVVPAVAVDDAHPGMAVAEVELVGNTRAVAGGSGEGRGERLHRLVEDRRQVRDLHCRARVGIEAKDDGRRHGRLDAVEDPVRAPCDRRLRRDRVDR